MLCVPKAYTTVHVFRNHLAHMYATDTLHLMTDTPAATPLTIPFHGRDIPVLEPTTEQWGLIVESSEWWRKNQRGLATVADRLKAEGGGDAATPAEEAARNLAKAGYTRIARVQKLIGALCADPDDWDWIQDGMAERTIPWEDVVDLPGVIGAAYRGGTVPNREERRAAAKGRGSRVR
jgi:hypothetical protein